MSSTSQGRSPTKDPSATPSGVGWSPKLASELASQLGDISLAENPFQDKFAEDGAIVDDDSQWGLGPPVELKKANESYRLLLSMDQEDGETHYMLQGNTNDALYHGHVETPKWKEIQSIKGDGHEFASLDLDWVSASHLFPLYLPSMKKYTGSTEAEDVFMKVQMFLKKSKYKNSDYAQCMEQEIRRCEEISRNPHRNLARYLGVETKIILGEERVVRIAYQRYSEDLHEFVLKKRLNLDNRVILMQGMRDGIKHLHEHNLVHCDLRPPNVFVTFKEEEGVAILEEVVVGDFDASLKVGEPVDLKRACGQWWPKEAEWHSPVKASVDDFALEQMETWLGNCLKENGLEEYVWDDAAASTPAWPEPPGGQDKEGEIRDEEVRDEWY